MINFDKNATTGTNKDIWRLMEKFAVEEYGNPSAQYSFADESKKAVETSKEIIAELLHCQPEEIYFLASGSEGDNWVLNSLCRRGSVAITSEIEHHAVLNTFKILSEERNVHVIYLPVDSSGRIDQGKLELHVPVSNLVSIMYVNNEIGTIQDIGKIGHLCRKEGVLFHTDAVQAFGKVHINVDADCIDFLSCSGHKFHGPKGIGFVYVRHKYKDLMRSWTYGGTQQDNLVAGTENVPGIVGLAKAAEFAYENFDKNQEKTHEVYWHFKSQLKLALPEIKYNAENYNIENCLSICFVNYGIRGEELLEFLNEFGICASSGSACNSSNKEPSHVLKAIGLTDDEASSSLRFSIDHENTVEEANEVIKALCEGVKLLGKK